MEPIIYPQSAHNISLEAIDPHAVTIVRRLVEHGYQAYLVGGCVRDLLLGHVPKDFDISTSAKPEEIKDLFRNSILIGRRFRLAHIRFGPKVFEVATFRSGSNEEDELIVRDNDWGTAAEDVMRRDFTINGLYYDPFEQTVIDYVGGVDDAKQQLLRAIGKPFLRFKQDPVRMIRLLKFRARFGLNVDPEMQQALLECRSEILKSSQARLFEELCRMLQSGAARRFFSQMADHGILELLLPRISHHLEHNHASSVYDYLDEIDRMHLEYPDLQIDRAVHLSALIFPILEERVQKLHDMHDKPPHLGSIQTESAALVHAVFHPFFHIPRRLKGQIMTILVTQFRMTPLTTRLRKPLRTPAVPDVILALKFLNLRYRLEPGLQEYWEMWSEAFKKSPPPQEKRRAPRRRRRR